MKSKAKLVEGMKSVVDNGRKHSVVLDLPEAKGGTDSGATALELVVMGLSGCITTIFASVAKNSNLSYNSIDVDVEALQEEGASTITSASAEVKVVSSESEKKVERIFKKTLEICPVAKLIEQAGIEIKHNLTIEN